MKKKALNQVEICYFKCDLNKTGGALKLSEVI